VYKYISPIKNERVAAMERVNNVDKKATSAGYKPLGGKLNKMGDL